MDNSEIRIVGFLNRVRVHGVIVESGRLERDTHTNIAIVHAQIGDNFTIVSVRTHLNGIAQHDVSHILQRSPFQPPAGRRHRTCILTSACGKCIGPSDPDVVLNVELDPFGDFRLSGQIQRNGFRRHRHDLRQINRLGREISASFRIKHMADELYLTGPSEGVIDIIIRGQSKGVIEQLTLLSFKSLEHDAAELAACVFPNGRGPLHIFLIPADRIEPYSYVARSRYRFELAGFNGREAIDQVTLVKRRDVRDA